jgi:hypothetical protein
MMRRLAVLVLWMLAAASLGITQDRPEDARSVQTVPGNCEMNAAALDSVRSEALEETNKGGVVIVIARLGTRETSGMQNRRRLQIVKTYLSKYGLGARRIVAAEGERVDGYGRVEFYVAGKLRVVLLANRNKPICVECCNADDTDPYRDKRNRSGTTKNHAGNNEGSR